MFLGMDFLRVWCGFLNFSVLSGLGFLYLDASHSFGIGILLGLVCAAVGVLISYWGIRRHYRRLAVLATSQSVDEEQGKAMEQLFRTRMHLTQVLGGLLALFNEVLMFNLYGPSFFSLESIVVLLFAAMACQRFMQNGAVYPPIWSWQRTLGWLRGSKHLIWAGHIRFAGDWPDLYSYLVLAGRRYQVIPSARLELLLQSAALNYQATQCDEYEGEVIGPEDRENYRAMAELFEVAAYCKDELQDGVLGA